MIALCLTVMLSGCATLGETFTARLPDQPADLRTGVEQPALTPGEGAKKALSKSRYALSQANSKIRRWNGFYDGVKKGYATKGRPTTAKKKWRLR
jgi:hypothetical protein